MQPTRPGAPRAAPPPPAAAGKARLGVISTVRLPQAPAVLALALSVLAVASPALPQPPPPQTTQEAAAATTTDESSSSTMCNVPPTLSGEDKQPERIKHPRSPEAARCTSKCVSTCVLGGAGAPGIGGPFNVRRPLVVFKDGFRSRQYCLVECSDICNLIKDGEDGQ